MSQVAAPDTKAVPSTKGVKTRRILRKKQVAPKPIKKYVWLAGHGLTLVCGGIYIALYLAKYILRNKWYWLPRIAYRLSFVGVLTAYTITVLSTFGSIIPGYHTLLATENFQSLVLAVVWLITRPSAFKLFPYYIISILQFSSRFNIKPILKLQDSLVDLITISEVVVFFTLLFDTLIFRGTSGYALVIYIGFYWLRINFSPYTQTFILKLVHAIDTKIMTKQKPAIQEKWQKVKDFVEFRREQTKTAISKGMDHEPEVKASNDHPDAGKPIGHAENYQLKGQQAPDPKKNKEQATEGIKVLKSDTITTNTSHLAKADRGEAPAGIASTLKETEEKNYKAGVMAASAAAGTGFATGAASAGARIGRQRNEHPTSKIPAHEQPRGHLQSTSSSSSSSVNAPSTPSSKNVAPASGRIQPGTASSPVLRQQGFNSAEQARSNSQQHGQQVTQDARASLTELQRRTQAGIASTQGRLPNQQQQSSST